MKKTLMIILSMGLMAFATSVQAGTASGSVNVGATAVNSCTVNTSTAVDFGSFSGAQIDLTAAAGGTVGYACTVAGTVVIALGAGNNLTGGSRNMTDGVGGNLLPYELYQTNSLVNVWGDNTHGTTRSFSTASFNGALAASMPAQTTYVPGTYTDIVAVNITF